MREELTSGKQLEVVYHVDSYQEFIIYTVSIYYELLLIY